MKSRKTFLTVALVVGLAACAVGSRVADYAIATLPTGASIHVSTRAATLDPLELLAVQDSGLMLADGNSRLVFVGYSRIRTLNIPKYGSWFAGYQPPSLAVREKWRVVSRYPQGISPALLQQLVQLTGAGVRHIP